MMASNPMQRKSRNSFLLGMIITLLITGVIIAFLLLMLKNTNDELQAELDAKVNVYTLASNVKAGQILTEDMFMSKSIHKDSIPSNATALAGVINSWFLQTKEGESVARDEYGLYLPQKVGDTRIEVFQNTEEKFEDYLGNEVLPNEYYITIIETEGAMRAKVASTSDVKKDKNGFLYIDTGKTRLYSEQYSTDAFYIYKTDEETVSTNELATRTKEYVDIKNVPVIARVDMNANTVITAKLVVQSDELVTDDTRQEEYNMITLPVDLMTNDYVDIRLRTPGGQNFIVVAKARVDIPMNADGTYIPDTMRVNLREDEILAMSCAIVEAYGLLGSELYVTKYVDPAMQEAALPTYRPNSAVTAQIVETDENGEPRIINPNIVEMAMQELRSRYSKAANKARMEYLQQMINNTDPEDYLENIQDGVEEDLGTSLTTRKQYLESLNYGQ